MSKTNRDAVASLATGCVLSLRTRHDNPNHHLWWNNGSWWLHATLHRADYTKTRLRLPLQTKRIAQARAKRDSLLAQLSAQTEVAR